MIEVQSVSKFYGNFKAVQNLSFRIDEGEIVGLLGLNGAGKSTILKILGCYLVPSHGDARIAGHSVYDDPFAVRKLIGYLPDRPPLYDEMSTRDYLKFVAALKNLPKAKIRDHVERAIAKTNLGDVADVRLGELSHGFQQRVGIAQALVHDPKVLILDEPINGLDPVQIVEMRDLILSLRGHHTVILSSHILSEITKTCDRILVIDKGHLVAEGTESRLRGEGRNVQEIHLELENYVAAVQRAIEALTGVSGVELSPDKAIMKISCNREVRPDIARIVVEHGGHLLSLSKQEAELESLFLKLIKGGV